MKRLVLMLCLITLIAVGMKHAYAPDKQKFKVCVSITCKDEITKSSFESHIKRNLRALQDVDIVTSKIEATYIIRLSAHEITKGANLAKTGYYAIAISIDEPFNALDELLPFLRKISPKPKNIADDDPLLIQLAAFDIDNMLLERKLQYHHTLIAAFTHSDELHLTCSEIVAVFDTKVLEVVRQR